MTRNALFLGVDGSGTRCRARLCDASGVKLAEAQAGPANIRFGVQEAFASVPSGDGPGGALQLARLTAQSAAA